MNNFLVKFCQERLTSGAEIKEINMTIEALKNIFENDVMKLLDKKNSDRSESIKAGLDQVDASIMNTTELLKKRQSLMKLPHSVELIETLMKNLIQNRRDELALRRDDLAHTRSKVPNLAMPLHQEPMSSGWDMPVLKPPSEMKSQQSSRRK